MSETDFERNRPSITETELTFFSLPRELRDEVYEYAFEPRRVELFLVHRQGSTGSIPDKLMYRLLRPRLAEHTIDENRPLETLTKIPFHILLVCKAIHEETRRLLYSKTQFTFGDPDRTVADVLYATCMSGLAGLTAMAAFAEQIPVTCRSAIRSFEIYYELMVATDSQLVGCPRWHKYVPSSWVEYSRAVARICRPRELYIHVNLFGGGMLLNFIHSEWCVGPLAFGGRHVQHAEAVVGCGFGQVQEEKSKLLAEDLRLDPWERVEDSRRVCFCGEKHQAQPLDWETSSH